MGVRANQVQAVLIPAGVALGSIAILTWYGMYWIPAKQRYLDERNVRLLRSIGTQIKVKVNNYDQAIDNALESFEFTPGRDGSDDFSVYVKLFTPDLEIIPKIEKPPGLDFYDPPRVKLVLDEGKNYLYLGYSHFAASGDTVRTKVIARTDIGASVAPYLSSHPEFDALALVDHTGRVIAQQSSSGVELARLDTIATALKTQGRDASNRIENLSIGGGDYRFYVQPVQLSLLRDTGEIPEEWRLCGLVRADHFRSASAEVSSPAWLLLLLTLSALLLSIPILKLHVLHPRGRYRAIDGVAVAISSFLLAGLVTFALLDVVYFGVLGRRDTRARLTALADELDSSLASEMEAASRELDVHVDSLARMIDVKTASDTGRGRIKLLEGDSLGCAPPSACRTNVLLDPGAIGPGRYPYYKLVTWSDTNGWQRYKWTTSRTVTPFINNSTLPYMDDVWRAHRLGRVSRVAQRGVAVIRSPNTAEALTIIWRALPPNSADLLVAALVTTPVSTLHPTLPWGAEFAVVDRTGLVVYHSDAARNLNENFFQETMDNGALRSAVLGHKTASVSADYLGRAYHMRVMPVRVTPSSGLADPGLSMIVLEQALISETVNLEVMTVAVLLFAAYAILLGIGWRVASWTWPRATDKWFWPDAGRIAAYVRVTGMNALLGATFLLVVPHLSAPLILAATVLIALTAIGGTFGIVHRSERDSNAPGRARFYWFLLARASFLFAVSVVPAMAAFEIAHEHESGLLAHRRSVHAAEEMAARERRVVSQQASLRLCPRGDECPEVAAFLTRRLADTAYDVQAHASGTGADSQPSKVRLASLLSVAHGAYNNIAVELQAAMPGNTADVDRPTFGYPILGALLALVVLFIVWKIMWPLYALDVYWSPGFVTAVPDGNLLIVGPAGSGRADFLLRRTPGIRVFDVGTLAFVGVDEVVSPARRPAVHDRHEESGEDGTPNWVDVLNASTLPENGVLALDDFDYRMDDPHFRALMLPVLENLVFVRHYTMWIATSVPPAELSKSDLAIDQADRWTRLFGTFRPLTLDMNGQIAGPRPSDEPSHVLTEAWRTLPEDFSVANSESEQTLREESAGSRRLRLIAAELTRSLPKYPAPSREDILFEFSVAAESYYRALFAACSMDQKLALHQLAETGVVNPRNTAVIAQLLRNGLVRRDPTFRVMNETFRAFVAREMSHESAAEWEREGVRLPWGSVSTMMLTVALLPIGLMLLTQQQLVGVWVGALPTLTPIVPSVVKLISSVGAKKVTQA